MDQLKDSAFIQLEKILQNDPNNGEAWRLQGDLYFKKTLFYEAIKCYIKSITIDQNYVEAWKGKGIVSIFQNNIVDAKQCFDLISFLTKKTNAEILLFKSHSYVWTKSNIPKIEKLIDNALNLDDSNSLIQISKALLLKMKGLNKDSLEYFEKITENDPKNIIALVNIEKIKTKNTNSTKIVDFVLNKFKISQKDFVTLTEISNTFLLNFDFDSARDFYEYLTSKDQNNINALKQLALISFIKNDSKSSLDFLSSYLEKNPHDSDSWTRKGEILRRQNKIEEAIQCFDIALKKDSVNPEAWRRKGFCQSMRHESFDEAIKFLDKSLEIDQYHPMTLVQKSNFLRRGHSNWNDSMYYLDKALEIDPSFILAWQQKSDIYKSYNDFESAMICYDNMVKLDADDVVNWYNLGVLQAKYAEKEYQKGIEFFNKSKLEKSLNCFEKVLSIDPNDVESILVKGKILESMKNFNDALNCYKQANKLDPHNIEIQNKIKILSK